MEKALINYFVELHDIYHYTLEVKAAFRAIYKLKKYKEEIDRRPPEYLEKHKNEIREKLDDLNEKARKGQYFIENERRDETDNPDALTSRIFKRIAEQNKLPLPIIVPGKPNPPRERLPLPRWSDERKKLYNEIYEIILTYPKLAGDELIQKFEEILD